jgi:sirohydrochlorin ferrochelatase
VSLLPVLEPAPQRTLDWASAGTLNRASPIVIVGHGSRDPRSSATMRRLADRVALRWAGPVTAAFLDFDPPNVPSALRSFVGDERDPVVVPALLTRAYHRKVDLPSLVSGFGVGITAVLGPESPGDPVDPRLVAALMRRVSEVESRFDGVALLAAGTSDPAACSTVDSVAAALGEALHVPCLVGYASTSEPSADLAVARVRRAGARRVVAASYFLASGRLHDAAEAAARRAGAVAVARPLGAAPELVDLVLARAASLA